MQKITKKQYNQRGQILIFVFVIMFIVVSAVAALVGYAGVQIKSHRQAVARTRAVDIAEAGLELAIWKLTNQPGDGGDTNAAYNNGTYNITLTNLSGSKKLVRADAYVPNATSPIAKKSIQVTLTIGTTNVGFNYGVQIGQGGLEMHNTATVVGNVYTTGNIIGSNSSSIQGTAIVASPNGIIDGMDIDGNSWSYTIRNGATVGGNATHAILQDTTVAGNVVADSISNCSIGGSATYDTRSSCSVSGPTTSPNNTDFVSAQPVDLPITDDQISTWEQEATDGGTTGTVSYNTGTHNLGPIKINGDLTLSNDAIVVVTGTIWVTGQIQLLNGSIMKLATSYGGLSGVVMAGTEGSSTAGYIETSQTSQALGSGTDGSYLMLLSRKTGIASDAIKTNQSTNSAIFYAGEGLIEVSQSATLKEITAYKLKIENSATVIYETGLARSEFVSGPSGGWELLKQSWQSLD